MEAELTIMCSGYLIPKEDTWENRLAKSTECFSSIEIQPPSLQQETEADMKIIPQFILGLNFEYDSVVVLTNDTDVLVLLLRYCAIFFIMKLKNLYIKIWDRDKHTVPSCPLTCKHPLRETMLKPIESSHNHWVRLAK